MGIQVKPSGSALGAEIIGADLTKPLDDATFAQVRARSTSTRSCISAAGG